jgi:peptidoglycan hydrolase-like protein with peptidoglycan-binding domain
MGTSVYNLQVMLSDLGYFPVQHINGVFGSLTKKSVLSYQISKGIIADDTDSGAGYVGPATLRQFYNDTTHYAIERVRGHGLRSSL